MMVRFVGSALVLASAGCLSMSSLAEDRKWDDASNRARDHLERLVERPDSPARRTGDHDPGQWVKTTAEFSRTPEPALSFLYLAATDDFVTAHVKQLMADATAGECPEIIEGHGGEKRITAADCTAKSGVRYQGPIEVRWHQLARGQYPEMVTLDNFVIEYGGVERRFSGYVRVVGEHYSRTLEMKMLVGVGENWFATTYARPLFSDDVSPGSIGVVPGVGSFQIRRGQARTVDEGQKPLYAQGQEIHPGRPRTVTTGSYRSLVGKDSLDIEIENGCYQMTLGRAVVHNLCTSDIADLMKLPAREPETSSSL
jgi:hypothetical protein